MLSSRETARRAGSTAPRSTSNWTAPVAAPRPGSAATPRAHSLSPCRQAPGALAHELGSGALSVRPTRSRPIPARGGARAAQAPARAPRVHRQPAAAHGHTLELELRRSRGAIGAWPVPRPRSRVSPAPPPEADRLGANVGAAAAAQAGESGGTGRRPRLRNVGAGIAVPSQTLTVNSLFEGTCDCPSLHATPSLLQFPLQSDSLSGSCFALPTPAAGTRATALISRIPSNVSPQPR